MYLLNVIPSSSKYKIRCKKINGYFIGYPVNSKGYMFYCPTYSIRIVETGNAIYGILILITVGKLGLRLLMFFVKGMHELISWLI